MRPGACSGVADWAGGEAGARRFLDVLAIATKSRHCSRPDRIGVLDRLVAAPIVMYKSNSRVNCPLLDGLGTGRELADREFKVAVVCRQTCNIATGGENRNRSLARLKKTRWKSVLRAPHSKNGSLFVTIR